MGYTGSTVMILASVLNTAAADVVSVDAASGKQTSGKKLPECRDRNYDCYAWAEVGECTKNSGYMTEYCPVSCGTCHLSTPVDPAVDCEDRSTECPSWAAAGECESNPTYMTLECARSCATCLLRDPKFRCPRNESETQRLLPGQMSDTFRRIEAGEWDRFGPVVVHSRDPWVVTLDTFLTAEEADAVVSLVDPADFERSSNVGGMDDSGRFKASFDESRTSTNAWCNTACSKAPLMQEISRRVEAMTGVPEPNAEYMQMLRYYPGQYYSTHHDYIPQHGDFPFGPRIYTFFLYLSDVDEGGETRFPSLNITVAPKKGRALIWPSVREDRPLFPDMRTTHEAVAVRKGVKYAGNLWLHQWDFRGPHAAGCAP